MSLHKRRPPPPPRVRRQHVNTDNTILEGTFLHSIIHTKGVERAKIMKYPVYQKDVYLRLLKKNNEDMGIPFVEPQYDEVPLKEEVKKGVEPELKYSDYVQVVLKVLKNGTVRVKTNTAIATLYEKNKKPGVKAIIQAYKSHGFSDEFLDNIKRKHERRVKFAKEKISAIIDKVFNKEPVKKVKRVKKKPEPIEEECENDDDEENEEDIIPDEEGIMDVEVDEPDEEQPQEEYVSDVDE